MTRYASGSIMKRGQLIQAKASGAEGASTTGASIEVGDSTAVYCEVTTTAIGTSMLMVIEGSNDGANWFTLGQIGSNGFVVGSAAAAPSTITTNATFRGVFTATQFVRYRSVLVGACTYSLVIEALAAA